MIVEKLTCAVQCYEWGRPSSKSLVAKLKESGDKSFKADEGKPYAELWMGIHKNGPSVLEATKQPLGEFITSNPSVLAAHEHGTIQFLFKVLSVNKALSIQSHPTKEQAKELHAKNPAHYPDDNHKPELAIALTDFQLLCGFRPAHELLENIRAHAEFRSLLKDESVLEKLSVEDENERKMALKQLFETYIKSSPQEIAVACKNMIERLQKRTQRSSLQDLLIRLNAEFPGDVGVFAPLLLNYFTLKSGESVFLEPNVPHAYLSGDCIECMACSDNTVRAGLTPKFKDVETLCSTLTFKMSPPPYFRSKDLSPSTTLYAPPVTEFAVQKIEHLAEHIEDVKASSILIVVSGSAVLQSKDSEQPVKEGEVVFLEASIGRVPILTSAGFLAYRAYTPAS